jgi:hypothetical protein
VSRIADPRRVHTVIAKMSTERAVRAAVPGASTDAKWPREIRVAVALASATACWALLIGAVYLVVQIF